MFGKLKKTNKNVQNVEFKKKEVSYFFFWNGWEFWKKHEKNYWQQKLNRDPKFCHLSFFFLLLSLAFPHKTLFIRKVSKTNRHSGTQIDNPTKKKNVDFSLIRLGESFFCTGNFFVYYNPLMPANKNSWLCWKKRTLCFFGKNSENEIVLFLVENLYKGHFCSARTRTKREREREAKFFLYLFFYPRRALEFVGGSTRWLERLLACFLFFLLLL